jgi:hypothetical protein
VDVYPRLAKRAQDLLTNIERGTETRFAYDRDNVWAELDANNNVQIRFGSPAAELLAKGWGGLVWGPNGLLRIFRGRMQIDLVDWIADPVRGGMQIDPSTVCLGQGSFIPFTP